MLLQQQKASPMVGQIISPDKRNAIAKEFKRTHFVLGGQGNHIYKI
jgi:hypothetical protein